MIQDTWLERLRAWLGALPQPRLVAIENASGYGLAIVRHLLAQREELVDVPATLTCDGRRGSGQRGKHDQGDALVIARAALRDRERLPRPDASVLDDELKLLADARDQLIVEAGRWRNRVHALLRVAAPGYQTTTGALASAGSARRYLEQPRYLAHRLPGRPGRDQIERLPADARRDSIGSSERVVERLEEIGLTFDWTVDLTYMLPTGAKVPEDDASTVKEGRGDTSSHARGSPSGYRALTSPPPDAVASYVDLVTVGSLAFVFGHGPFENGEFVYLGKLGRDMEVATGQDAERLTIKNPLATLKAESGNSTGSS